MKFSSVCSNAMSKQTVDSTFHADVQLNRRHHLGSFVRRPAYIHPRLHSLPPSSIAFDLHGTVYIACIVCCGLFVHSQQSGEEEDRRRGTLNLMMMMMMKQSAGNKTPVLSNCFYFTLLATLTRQVNHTFAISLRLISSSECFDLSAIEPSLFLLLILLQ